MKVEAVVIAVWLLCGFIASGWMWADVRAEGNDMRYVTVMTPFFICSGPMPLIGWPLMRYATGESHGWEMPFTNIGR